MASHRPKERLAVCRKNTPGRPVKYFDMRKKRVSMPGLRSQTCYRSDMFLQTIPKGPKVTEGYLKTRMTPHNGLGERLVAASHLHELLDDPGFV